MDTYLILYVEKDKMRDNIGQFWEIVGDAHFKDIVINDLITNGYRIIDVIKK